MTHKIHRHASYFFCKTIALFLAAVLLLLLAGCGSVGSSAAMSSDTMELAPTEGSWSGGAGALNGTVQAPGLSPTSQPDLLTDRKIIYTADLTLESTHYEDTLAALLAALDSAGGYVESSSTSGSAAEGGRHCSYTLRVPAAQYRSFLETAASAGTCTYRSEDTQDVTADYVDLDARLETLKAERTRLETLMEQAGSLEELLLVEERLTAVQADLESYTAQLRALSSRIDSCTVCVELSEVVIAVPSGNRFVARAGTALRDSFVGFVRFLQEAAIALIYLLPYLLVLAVIALVVVLLVRRQRRLHPRRAAAPHTAQAAAYTPLYTAAPGAPAAHPAGDTPAEDTEDHP